MREGIPISGCITKIPMGGDVVKQDSNDGEHHLHPFVYIYAHYRTKYVLQPRKDRLQSRIVICSPLEVADVGE